MVVILDDRILLCLVLRARDVIGPLLDHWFFQIADLGEVRKEIGPHDVMLKNFSKKMLTWLM